jgi:hypothetical protein
MMDTLPPTARLWQIATGHLLPRCLYAVAQLGVADRLDADAPRPIDEIARAVGADADALARMLRLLATVELFADAGDGRLAHTELSLFLRSDHPQSIRPFVRMIGGPINWAAAGAIEHSARTGRPAVEQVAPEGMWAWYEAHPEQARIFDAAMTAKSAATIAGLARAFDFTPYATIADIGGGRGHILAAALDAAPRAQGILFDLPHVVRRLEPRARIALQGGDFFEDALPAADAYLLGNVLHDWADAEALAILRAVARAAPRHAHLLVLESILPETPGPHHAKALDIVMLLIAGGRERTRDEYAALFAAGGWRLERVVPTASPISVLVGVPA